MKRLIDHVESVKLHDTIVMMGKFDGFHLGHQQLLKEAIRLKTEHDERCPDEEPWHVLIFTFDVHPGRVLNVHTAGSASVNSQGSEGNGSSVSAGGVKRSARTMRTIQTHDDRFLDAMLNEVLDEALDEVDYFVEFTFNKESMSIEPEQFVKEVLVDHLDARRIVCGYDFRFGKDRKGNVKMLQELGTQYGFEVLVVPKMMIRFESPDGTGSEEHEISSTLIREETLKGNMEHVAAMLGRQFCITGRVMKGKQLGHTIGFPTANLLAPDNKILPPDGVYATKTMILDKAEPDSLHGEHKVERDGQKTLLGITNLGRRPTFDDGEQRTVETFLFDFHGDLYDKEIRVEFMHFIRPERKFDNVEKLQEQMKLDMEAAKEYFQNAGA